MSNSNFRGRFGVRTRGERSSHSAMNSIFGVSHESEYINMYSVVTEQDGESSCSQSDGNEDEGPFVLVEAKKKRKRKNTGGESFHFPDASWLTSMSNKEQLSLILQKLSSMEEKVNNTDHAVSKLVSVNKRMSKIEKSAQDHSNRLKLLEYKSIDIEARSRRKNLLFRGIPESRNEGCFDKIRAFIEEKLEIPLDMYLERAHRLGKFSRTYARPIVASFRDFYDTELIMQEAYKLKGSDFGISKDYPAEITEARKELWPYYKEARAHKHNKVSIKYPAKLVVNGEVTHDCFPDWGKVMQNKCVVHAVVKPKQPPRVHVPAAPSPPVNQNRQPTPTGNTPTAVTTDCTAPPQTVICTQSTPIATTRSYANVLVSPCSSVSSRQPIGSVPEEAYMSAHDSGEHVFQTAQSNGSKADSVSDRPESGDTFHNST